MKVFFNLLGMVLAGLLGYMVEPNFRYQLTGQSPTAVEVAESGRVVLQMGNGAPKVDLEKIPAAELPAQVLVRTSVKVTSTAAGMTMTIDAGNRVKLISIEGGNAVISPAEGFTGKIPILDTDLLDQLGTRPQPATTPPAAEPSAAVPPVMASEEPVTPPVTPEPAPEVAATPEPEPQETPEAAPVAEPAAGGSDPVAAMKASLEAGQIQEFKAEQVQEWTAGDDESVDGENYQTGIASYQAETIFGVKTIQAKALIKGGKVQRWIWPKSGMEIK